MVIEVTINGVQTTLESGACVSSLLHNMGYAPSKTAVWVNKHQLLMGDYAARVLSPGDEVKIVRLFGGG